MKTFQLAFLVAFVFVILIINHVEGFRTKTRKFTDSNNMSDKQLTRAGNVDQVSKARFINYGHQPVSRHNGAVDSASRSIKVQKGSGKKAPKNGGSNSKQPFKDTGSNKASIRNPDKINNVNKRSKKFKHSNQNGAASNDKLASRNKRQAQIQAKEDLSAGASIEIDEGPDAEHFSKKPENINNLPIIVESKKDNNKNCNCNHGKDPILAKKLDHHPSKKVVILDEEEEEEDKQEAEVKDIISSKENVENDSNVVDKFGASVSGKVDLEKPSLEFNAGFGQESRFADEDKDSKENKFEKDVEIGDEKDIEIEEVKGGGKKEKGGLLDPLKSVLGGKKNPISVGADLIGGNPVVDFFNDKKDAVAGLIGGGGGDKDEDEGRGKVKGDGRNKDPISGAIGNVIGTKGNVVGDILGTKGNVVGDVIGEGANIIGDVLGGKKNIVGDLINGRKENAVGDALDTNKNVIGDVLDGNKNIIGDVIDGKKNIIGDVIEGKKKIIDDAEEEVEIIEEEIDIEVPKRKPHLHKPKPYKKPQYQAGPYKVNYGAPVYNNNYTPPIRPTYYGSAPQYAGNANYGSSYNYGGPAAANNYAPGGNNYPSAGNNYAGSSNNYAASNNYYGPQQQYQNQQHQSSYQPYPVSKLDSYPETCKTSVFELQVILKKISFKLNLLGKLFLSSHHELLIDEKDIVSRLLADTKLAINESLGAASVGNLSKLNELVRTSGISLYRLAKNPFSFKLYSSLQTVVAQLRKAFINHRKFCADYY